MEENKSLAHRIQECESQTLTSQELNQNLLKKLNQLTTSLSALKKDVMVS